MSKFGIFLIVTFACACGRSPERKSLQEDGSHPHTTEATQTTLFSDNTEFLIEYEPLEAGEESAFLIHATNLQTYKPYTSGYITIEMDGLNVTSAQPVKEGIFVVPYVPAEAGEFHITYTLQSGENTESVTDHIHVSKGHSHGHHHSSPKVGEISFLKEQAWKGDFMVKKITETSFSPIISASGEIMAVPGVKKSVAARSSGIVHFTTPYLVQGSQVSKGQLLFVLSSKTLIENNVELQYKDAKNSLNTSRTEYLRHEKLYESGVVSERLYTTSKSEYISDSLHFYSLSANVTQHGLQIVAPISGYIHQLNTSDGEYEETGNTLVTISSNNYLMIRADLPQQYFQQLSDIYTANFRPAYTNQTYSIEEFNGNLIATGSSVAENNHYLPVYFKVENDGRLLEGAFAELYLKTKEKVNCLTVPLNALSEEQGNFYLYIQVTGESFTKHPVTPGRNDGKQIEILSGLRSGERIVTNGVMLVKAASMVTSVAGQGHSH